MQTRNSILALGTAFAVTAALAQNGPVRPKITGISHLAVYYIGRRSYGALLHRDGGRGEAA